MEGGVVPGGGCTHQGGFSPQKFVREEQKQRGAFDYRHARATPTGYNSRARFSHMLAAIGGAILQRRLSEIDTRAPSKTQIKTNQTLEAGHNSRGNSRRKASLLDSSAVVVSGLVVCKVVASYRCKVVALHDNHGGVRAISESDLKLKTI